MGNRFVWSRPPIAGELLLGFVTRNADVHAADKDLPGAPSGGHRDYCSGIVADGAPGSGAGVGIPVHDDSRGDPFAGLSGRRASGAPDAFVSFFGTPLRKLYLELYRRRVSPGSLRRSGHHRALWDIRPLSFCVESKEVLSRPALRVRPNSDGVGHWGPPFVRPAASICVSYLAQRSRLPMNRR